MRRAPYPAGPQSRQYGVNGNHDVLVVRHVLPPRRLWNRGPLQPTPGSFPTRNPERPARYSELDFCAIILILNRYQKCLRSPMSITAASSSSRPPTRRSTVADKDLNSRNGYLMVTVCLALIVLSAWLAWTAFASTEVALYRAGLGVIGIVVALTLLAGLVILQPNESLVCLLFGSYVGTEHRPGFWWINPFNSKRKISRRLETLESGPLKVNDAVGNPIDIGAVIVWRVEDAAKALLEVGSYANYVKAQSETALRRLASVHPYDLVEAEEAVTLGERPISGKEKPEYDHTLSTVSLRDGGD